MLITGFAAGMFATNCYVVAEHSGSEAVIVDPGQEAAPTVRAVLAEHALTPVAVLLTHGHLDHTWDAAAISDEFSIPVYIHPADRPMLADPGMGMGNALRSVIGDVEFREPARLVEFADRDELRLAGIGFDVDHAPGHTQGSVLLTIEAPTDNGPLPVCFAGDVLFAGSIGRTDLPGGDHQQLLDSIATRLLGRPGDTQVLPGHGPQTTIAAERMSNPFLVGLPGVADAAASAPRRGRGGL